MHAAMLLWVTALRIPCIDLLDAPSDGSLTFSPAESDKPAALPGPPPASVDSRPPAGISGVNEQVTYDVRYGFLGQVGELRLSATPVSFEPNGAPILRILGEGSGDVLGLGRFERRIETEFDVATWASRHWRSTRRSSGLVSDERVTDLASRLPGDKLELQRRKGDSVAPTSTATLMPASTTSDPLGVIWRLRNQPPAPGETQILQLLDGMALWRIEIHRIGGNGPVPESSRIGMQFVAHMTPILYNGTPDGARPERHFTLWLQADPGHLPLRLEMPLGPADAVLTLREPPSPPPPI
jgi:hypothetical protein